jgi:transmembrane sensor
VMRKLSRWYDVEVVFDGVTDKTVTAQISRFDNISKILEKIRFTRAASFRVEGRRIIVMP